jgi:hypothetical protein
MRLDVVIGAWLGGLFTVTAAARGDVIYESARPGDLGGYSVLKHSPASYQSVGVRFHLANPSSLERVGGYFQVIPTEPGVGIFGAIIRLTGPTDVPDSVDPLDTPDVLGVALVDVDGGRGDYSGAFSKPLVVESGWYALLFGSGQFGASAAAAAYGGGAEAGSGGASYIWTGDSWNPGRYNQGGVADVRFFVEGQVTPATVPEPSGAVVGLLAAGAGLLLRRRGAVARSR